MCGESSESLISHHVCYGLTLESGCSSGTITEERIIMILFCHVTSWVCGIKRKTAFWGPGEPQGPVQQRHLHTPLRWLSVVLAGRWTCRMSNHGPKLLLTLTTTLQAATIFLRAPLVGMQGFRKHCSTNKIISLWILLLLDPFCCSVLRLLYVLHCDIERLFLAQLQMRFTEEASKMSENIRFQGQCLKIKEQELPNHFTETKIV